MKNIKIHMYTPSQFYAKTIKDQIQKDNLEGQYNSIIKSYQLLKDKVHKASWGFYWKLGFTFTHR